MGKNQLATIDRQTCQELRFLLDRNGSDGARLCIDETTDLSLLSYFGFLTGFVGIPVRLSREELDRRIAQVYPSDHNDSAKTSQNTARPPEAVSESRVVDLINGFIHDSIAEKASDVHFEPAEDWLACRTRIDGLLTHKQTINRDLMPEVISRLKIMAGLDIAEKRRPQDGRIRFPYDDRAVDIRVSVIPTDFGEKVVLRILDKATLRLDLETLGFGSSHLRLFRDKITASNGMVLVTGPTGSGKTTTLYAALNHLKSPQVNISTIEDPIEYSLAGINQTQVKPEIDLTFSNMLRALLRQDPNIIMVGEIRDPETLDIGIHASLTGHLVLSTLHTNNAIATISRLVDMGAEPYMLASTLRLIVAQRLLRLNCTLCLSDRLSNANRAAAAKLGLALNANARESIGCRDCRQTGFAGRTAIYELLVVDDPLKVTILHRKSEAEMLGQARTGGFATLLDAAQELVNSGRTTPLEVLREINV